MGRVALCIHALWVIWMIGGVLLAVLGYWKRRLWELTFFRTAHLIGIVATATVPIWNDGQCPITQWESTATGHEIEPFLIRALASVVYWDVSPALLASVTAGSALLTIVIFWHHPPGRLKQLQLSLRKVGRSAQRD